MDNQGILENKGSKVNRYVISYAVQGSHRLEKYLNIQDCLENKICLENYLKNTQRA